MRPRRWMWACALLLASPASAGAESATERAATLFKQGRAAMERKKLAEACPKFAESARLDPAPGTFLNLALCEEGRGNLREALTAYRAVLEMLPPQDERLPFAKQHAQALEGRVARLTLVLSPAVPSEAKVFQDNVEVARSKLGTEELIDPGTHEVTLRIPGSPDTDLTVALTEGERRTLVVMPAAGARAQPETTPPAGSAGGPEVGPGANEDDSAAWQAPLGYAIGGLGAAGIAAGFVTGAMALKRKDIVEGSCDRNQVCDSQAGVDAADEGQTLAAISTLTFAVGAAALATGLVVVITSPDKKETKTAVALAPLPYGGALTVRRSF